jgi:hypothetical protein
MNTSAGRPEAERDASEDRKDRKDREGHERGRRAAFARRGTPGTGTGE